MAERDVVSWSSMIGMYVKVREHEHRDEPFYRRIEARVRVRDSNVGTATKSGFVDLIKHMVRHVHFHGSDNIQDHTKSTHTLHSTTSSASSTCRSFFITSFLAASFVDSIAPK